MTPTAVKSQSAQWFYALVESVAGAIIVSRTNGSIEFINKAAERLTGTPVAKAVEGNLETLLRLRTKEGIPVRTDLINLAILSESGMTLGHDLLLSQANGEQIDVEGEIAPFHYSGSVLGVIVTLRDVTLRNREENTSHRNRTLHAVAQLASSIAHDINNALTLILGNTEKLLTHIPQHDPARAAAEQIRDAGDLAVKMSGQLQVLGRKEFLLPTVIDLNAVIEQQVNTLRGLAGNGIQIEPALARLHGEFQADPEQIRTMLTNFVLHGAHFLPLGGRISFQTADVKVEPSERGARTRKYVRLRVTYSGKGIKDEDLNDLFNPFWGPEGEAHGLEMFTIAGIVSDASGHISVEAEAGVSITFDVSFPCIEEPHPLLSSPQITTQNRMPTILLVEDDDDIRSLLSQYFDRRGYHLLEARDGEDALTTSQYYDGPIDVLITDFEMPRMSGPQLVNLLAKNRPETKALLISGYAPEPAALSELLDRGVNFLQKPFRSEELLSEVQRMLSERRTKVN